MIKLSIGTFVLGLVLSFFMFSSVMAQTATPVVPTSPPSTGRAVK